VTDASIVPREQTQARLDRRSAVSLRFLASSSETTADLVEAAAERYGARD
jgi:hypothetical protein